MSAQFGSWNLSGHQPAPDYLKKVDGVLAPYGPDGVNHFTDVGISIHYHAFHTTKEARCESQPLVSPSGAVITWDGRLDNRAELIQLLKGTIRNDLSDVSIVAAAYEQWGVDGFARLVGDWALAIWDPLNRSLILAKDFVGIRHLYYSFDEHQVTWSTVLDPLVLFAGKPFALCEEYLAGWFSYFPAGHLTPYVGVHSVPPSCFVRFRQGKCATEKYWDFDPNKRIRYRTDAEYEEHFRAAFGEAVLRRLRCDGPILAELSGGVDSSAIVCIADELLRRGTAEVPRLDTVSYYDDSEPNWNERPYFTTVEKKRGRTGCHIDVTSQELFTFQLENDQFCPTPASVGRASEPAKQFATCMTSQPYRVLLSGIGGDEVTGGVPTPIPELEDLLARGQTGMLAHALKVWALNKRRPWLHLLFEATRGFLPPSLVSSPKSKRPPVWMSRRFVRRNRGALHGYQRRIRLWGPLPTFQENLGALDVLRRQLGCSVAISPTIHEKRYPYLDRDLLAFLYAVPREQLVRPGQRRSLMRRALAGLVPAEVLERKRKAFVSRSPSKALTTQRADLANLTTDMVAASLGLLNANVLQELLKETHNAPEFPILPLMRTLVTEVWLRRIHSYGIRALGLQ